MLIRTFVAVLVAALTLSAGEAERALSGRVSDGASPVAAAIVTITSADTVMSATTDNQGRFMLPAVPTGRYDLRVSAGGYAVLERHVTIHAHEQERNWVDISGLVPAGQQTVSVRELLEHKNALSNPSAPVPSPAVFASTPRCGFVTRTCPMMLGTCRLKSLLKSASNRIYMPRNSCRQWASSGQYKERS